MISDICEDYEYMSKITSDEEKKNKDLSTKSDELSKLKSELNDERIKSKEYLNRLKYLQADFENSIKRTKIEVEEARKFSNENLIMNLLEVLENLERAIEVGEKIHENSDMMIGIKMVLKQLNDILNKEGLEVIPAEGKIFDPNLHEAMIRTESENRSNGEILNEIKRGYKLKGKIIRVSKVEVAVNPIKES